MKIIVTYKELSEKGVWDSFCEKHGIDPYCMAEGLCGSDTEVELTYEEARDWGFIEQNTNRY